MPPKGSKKAVAPSTPKAEDVDEGSNPSTPPTETKKKTPRKPKAPPKVFSKLPGVGNDPILIDVAFENDTTISNPLPKGGGHGQMIKLVAPQPFELVASYMLEDGLQAVVIKPSKAFPFLKLPIEIRSTILQLIFDPNNKGSKIEITCDKETKPRAKEYAKDKKHRASILVSNKELHEQAVKLLYSYKFKFDNTTTLLNFLTTIGDQNRKRITKVHISQYTKSTAMPAMTMLADCHNLTNVNIHNGIGVSTAPLKTAKTFFNEAGRLLQSLVQHNGGDKDAALDIVTFGAPCMTIKDDEEVRDWDQEEVDIFRDTVLSKLK